ncbi:hypothetical protein IV38_GL001236 [Lactobacillus selangorensis]|uniref:Transposase n=1 Tax=Lactobacillus selangorensis TaxID=81857 RepID=A0A0R2FVY2_9LACO|nr:hypothetical protein [Lactobacillus selangorensis]KRN29021.1 hypothetical protein IV38_GL001236 [Lactobacillus selangorensis]KRN32569.1 hypothetical protein IV40_GL000617 [Lactobacillus selangorensis]
MFGKKQTKEQPVETDAKPVTEEVSSDFEQMLDVLDQHQWLIIPIALAHAIPAAIAFHGLFKTMIYHEKLQIEREKTRRAIKLEREKTRSYKARQQ